MYQKGLAAGFLLFGFLSTRAAGLQVRRTALQRLYCAQMKETALHVKKYHRIQARFRPSQEGQTECPARHP